MHRTSKKFCLSKISLAGLMLFGILFVSSAIADGKFNASKRYLYVQPGQSVFTIVKILYPTQRDDWPAIIKRIVRKNPHAFVGADATKIRTGERLEIPSRWSNVKPVAVKAVVYKEPQAVGQVIKTRGKTFLISKDKKKRNLDLGSEVYVGDRIFTGVKGFIRLSMIDEAKIDLRCNSEMIIEDYQLMRGKNRSVIYLLKGSVKKITGSIGKMADDFYEMRTPLATVGVRGTEYALRVLQTYGCDGSMDVNSKGLFVKVNKGGIDVKGPKDEVSINNGETALIADKNSKTKSIQPRDGIFANQSENEEKAGLFMSFFWLAILASIMFVLRKRSYGN